MPEFSQNSAVGLKDFRNAFLQESDLAFSSGRRTSPRRRLRHLSLAAPSCHSPLSANRIRVVRACQATPTRFFTARPLAWETPGGGAKELSWQQCRFQCLQHPPSCHTGNQRAGGRSFWVSRQIQLARKSDAVLTGERWDGLRSRGRWGEMGGQSMQFRYKKDDSPRLLHLR